MWKANALTSSSICSSCCPRPQHRSPMPASLWQSERCVVWSVESTHLGLHRQIWGLFERPGLWGLQLWDSLLGRRGWGQHHLGLRSDFRVCHPDSRHSAQFWSVAPWLSQWHIRTRHFRGDSHAACSETEGPTHQSPAGLGRRASVVLQSSHQHTPPHLQAHL